MEKSENNTKTKNTAPRRCQSLNKNVEQKKGLIKFLTSKVKQFWNLFCSYLCLKVACHDSSLCLDIDYQYLTP